MTEQGPGAVVSLADAQERRLRHQIAAFLRTREGECYAEAKRCLREALSELEHPEEGGLQREVIETLLAETLVYLGEGRGFSNAAVDLESREDAAP